MYHYNDFETWQHHHDELLREAEMRRVARQLRATRSKEDALRIPRSWARLVAGFRAQDRNMAGC